ncbi:MAG TPA: pitrilysin family protein [Thermoanaerobaculia bacterium]|nr:pitrilysin family protein [Thermoanaerobaculia bacterium]
MNRTRRIAFVLALAASCPLLAEKQTPPAPGKPKDFQVPKPRKITLDNGMGVTFVPYGTVPKVTLRLSVRTGSIDEAANQVWLGNLMGDMLTQGTATRSASQIAQQSADMGGEISVNVTDDRTDVGADVLSEFGPDAAKLLADVVRNPRFPEAELGRLKGDRLRRLSIAKSNPQAIVAEKFRAVLYGDHPYGRLFPTPEMVQAYTIEQVRGFYDANFGAARSRLYVVGRYDEAAMEKAIRTAFAGWKKGAPPSARTPKPKGERRVEILDRPGAVQSTIFLGMPTVDPSSPDFLGLTVTDAILGGSFASRITSNIREQKGYTYSPGSQLSSRYRDAYWVEVADVTTKDTGASLKEIFFEIDRLRAEPPSASELRGIQNYLAGVFVLRNSSRPGIIQILEYVDLHGLPEDYLNTYIQKVYAVTPADVQRIAAKYIEGDKATIVVAGDQKTIADQLAPYGKAPAAH